MLRRNLSLLSFVFYLSSFIFSLSSLVFAQTDIRYSNLFNVNILRSGVLFQDRFRADIYSENDIGKTVINIDLDNTTGLSQNKFLKLAFYRFNQELIFSESTVVVGLQGVPFGVCRLWNPTDKFNPVYALSLEPDQRKGVLGVNYRYYLSIS